MKRDRHYWWQEQAEPAPNDEGKSADISAETPPELSWRCRRAPVEPVSQERARELFARIREQIQTE